MRTTRPRASPRLVWLAILTLSAGGAALAENIDPGNNGAKYAWSENLGWLNARPGGPGGAGIHVPNSGLTGWMWSESAGWVSLSCANTSACGTSSYRVGNDGCGNLSGRAWSENLDWIDFAPANCGGDPTCGVNGSKAGDWRLPTVEEWEAINMFGCYSMPGGPTIPDKTGTACYLTGIQWATNVQPNPYWSSSTNTASPSDAWAWDLGSQEVNGGTKTFNLCVWPVRVSR